MPYKSSSANRRSLPCPLPFFTESLFFFCFLSAGQGPAQAQKPSKIIEFDAPGADQGTIPEQNTLFGVITGFSLDANGVAHGFVRSPGGEFTTFDAPGAGAIPDSGEGTFALAINPAGAVSGLYVDANNVAHAFVRSHSGTITSFDPSGSVFTNGDTLGINPAGAVSGGYTDSNGVSHGFVRSPSGTITSFDAPGAGTNPDQGSAVLMITASGTTPGLVIDGDNVLHGFLRFPNGAFITFDASGAGTNPGQGTSANASNLLDITTGDFIDSNNVQHGFVRIPGGRIFEFDAPDAGTGVFQGEIVGFYIDTNGVPHGFLRFP